MAIKSSDEIYMAKALKFARKGVGYTSPNPAVGCVIVKDGQIVASDFHRQAGQPHAEILALRQAGDNAKDSDLYVTLEPCCIYGRTPPCTEAIIAAGIKRVIIGTLDPNPKVNGDGAGTLRKAGVEVTTGVLEDDCRELNTHYNKFIRTGLPYVTIKYAQSLDGRIAVKSGSSQWISSPQARKYAHKLRANHDAILIGASTANIDDPQLTVRLVKGKNPRRIILSGRGKLKSELKMFSDGQGQILVVTSKDKKDRLKNKYDNTEIIAVEGKDGSLNLKVLLKLLANQGITSILVEGGSGIITSFIKAGLVDKLVLIVAPLIIGEGITAIGDLGIEKIAKALKLANIKQKKIGSDCAIIGEFA